MKTHLFSSWASHLRGGILLAPTVFLLAGCVHAAEAPEAVPPAGAQPAVVVAGKGSYASFPPPEVDKDARPTLEKPLYLLPEAQNRPIPTNKWWTDLLVSKYAGQIWTFPHQVKANENGLEFTFPNRWNESGSDPVSENPLRITGDGFKPVDARAKDWSDWLVSFRLGESADRYWDVTLGRGMPYMWLEPHGVNPQLRVDKDTTFFNAGGEVMLPQTANQLGITFGGRSYGIFAPDGTQFVDAGDRISVQYQGTKQFLVVCPLPAPDQLETFHKYAYAIPRRTEMSWSYDPAKATITSHWHIETEALQGTEKRLWQGWLPHHYRETQNDLKLDGPKYLTPRGEMQCALGTDFNITYPFRGLPFANPAPKAHGGPHEYDPQRMADYVARYATRTEYGDDTYWGGKHLLQMGQYMSIARQIGAPERDTIQANLKKALEDWLTYTPGEKAHFFARYPRWQALVGFKTSYGSEAFNDQHFHYGYLTVAAAMLGAEDPQFLKEYAPMLELVAREYGNWDRTRTDFPFLRTFDVWEGHSWAGGYSGGTGNNQESSSEAIQSWAGLFWLGEMLGNRDMAACGAMGYAMETSAIREYWFNQNGGNWSPNWKHDVVGMIWSGGNNYGTYFSGDPAWIWGIQWLPMTPALTYLMEDPAFARKSFGQMWAARKEKEGNVDLEKIGPALGNVLLGQAAQCNPAWVAEQMDQLWDAGSKVAHDNDTPGLTYNLAHTNLTVGDIQWNMHLDQPLSRVYLNPKTKAYTFIAFNPADKPVKAAVYKDGKVVGHLSLPAHGWVTAGKMEP